MTPVKVLYMIGTLDLGGTEQQLVELATRLDRRFRPVVCCLFTGGPLVDRLVAAGVPVEVICLPRLQAFRGVARLRWIPKLVAGLVRFFRVVRRERPDIVHGFLFAAYVLGAFAARSAGTPVVVASRRSLGNFKAGKSYELVFERIASRLTDLVIANSWAVRQDVLERERLPADQVVVIHNGVDTSRFAAVRDEVLGRALGLVPGAPVVGVIANFIHYKGYEYFLEAWQSVLARLPRATALLVGDGVLRPDIEAMAARMGLGESVRFLGARRDVPAILGVVDLVVHPSLEEGFSNAILEGMAAGKPVVATAVGGNPEAVVHGETGLLVPPRDSRALAEAIAWCLEHPADARRFGEAGRRHVTERFSAAAMVSAYEAVYERLLRDKRPGRAPATRAVAGKP